jgi:putative ABC transport system permease protein
VPLADLLILLAGLPLVAAAGGWLLAGRDPDVISRQPLD